MELLSGPVKYDFVICTYDFVAQSYAQKDLWPKWLELLNIHGYEEASRKPRMRRFARMYQSGETPYRPLHSDVYREFSQSMTLILDEGHAIKNLNSLRYKAVASLPYNKILILTGTPMANKWYDILGPVSLISGHVFSSEQASLFRFQQVFGTCDMDLRGAHTAAKKSKSWRGDPTGTRHDLFIKFLQPIVMGRPATILKLPPCHNHNVSFDLTIRTATKALFEYEGFIKAVRASQSKTQRQTEKKKRSPAGRASKAQQIGASPLLLLSTQELQAGKQQPDDSGNDKKRHYLEEAERQMEQILAAEPNLSRQEAIKKLIALRNANKVEIKRKARAQTGRAKNATTTSQISTFKVPHDGDDSRMGVDQEEELNDPVWTPGQKLDVEHEDNDEEEEVQEEDDDNIDDNYSDGDDDTDDDLDAANAKQRRKEDAIRRNLLRDYLANAKLDDLQSERITAITDLLAAIMRDHRGEKTIIFSVFLRFIDILERVIALRQAAATTPKDPFGSATVFRIDGSMSANDRTTAIAKFEADTSGQTIFLITTGAGNEGLNLMAASHLILAEPNWNGNAEIQAAAQVWRSGQTKECHIYHVKAANSPMDHHVEQVQEKKKSYCDRAMQALRRDDGQPVVIKEFPLTYVR